MESNENSIDEICQDSLLKKKYRIIAYKLIQSVVVQYAKYKRTDEAEGFKADFLFKNWKNFTLLLSFKKLRKKYRVKYGNPEDEGEVNGSEFHSFLAGYHGKLDQMLNKVNNITYRCFDFKRDTGKVIILIFSF
jgi:hypothetical protein